MIANRGSEFSFGLAEAGDGARPLSLQIDLVRRADRVKLVTFERSDFVWPAEAGGYAALTRRVGDRVVGCPAVGICACDNRAVTATIYQTRMAANWIRHRWAQWHFEDHWSAQAKQASVVRAVCGTEVSEVSANFERSSRPSLNERCGRCQTVANQHGQGWA